MSLVGVACLAATMLVAGLLRWRRRLARLEGHLRRLRALSVREVNLRPLAAGERDVSALDAASEELAALGLTILGDALEDAGEDGRQPTRWFADAAGTTFGWIGLVRGLRLGFLLSSSPERVAITRIVPRPLPSLAQPPFIDRVEHCGTDKLADALAAHRARVPAGAAVVRTLDAAIAEMRALRERTIAWREAQAPGELLERDLRAILGRHYERLGPVMARRLGVRLPEARINR
ncbi:MAG: hypothetical protein ACM31C_18800 [Acidobacteriota bacterium]